MPRFQPTDRNYSSWTWSDGLAHDNVNPVQEKLIVDDEIEPDDEIVVHSSPYRTSEGIPGVIALDGSTYGRYGSRMLYKCVPSDHLLPAFMIPYSEKHSSFAKKKTNRYVLFRFVEWEDKHPLGVITHTIGAVDDLSAFYNFQMIVNQVHYSVKSLAKHVKSTLPVNINETNMENRRDWETIAIDPVGCTDFDDALGLCDRDDGTSIVSVYIANVPMWLDALDAWGKLSDQVATVYLPNEKRSMLPAILSENLCSLCAGSEKYVVAMDIETKHEKVQSIEFRQCIVEINHNYVYDEAALLECTTYTRLFDMAKQINKDRGYVDQIKNSHDVVELFMVMMNHEVSKCLFERGCGIFRDVKKTSDVDVKLAHDNASLSDFLRIWRHIKGLYVNANDHEGHCMLALPTYLQVTSPIRRVTDLVNIAELIGASESAQSFISKVMSDLGKLNDQMRRIKKVQTNCKLLEYCVNQPNDALMEAWVVEPGVIYIPTIEITTNVDDTSQQISEGVQVRLHVFTDESTLWRKVRIEVL
jgi:hypothetical protein